MRKCTSVIAMSDLHLGKPENYLHVSDPAYDKNREAVIEMLRKLGPQDQLILNGDLMELSLAGWDDVYEDLKSFFGILSEGGPYQKIIYIPGNHDHHFWRMLVEQTNITGRMIHGGSPPSNEMYPYCFVDVRFSSHETHEPCEAVLPHLWPDNHEVPEFVIKYPHHLFAVPNQRKVPTYYFFTHGHFLEPLFKPINFIIEPAHLEELEAFNNVWLEAFDYDLGHAGRMSERIYEMERIWQEGGYKAQQTVRQIFKEIQKVLMEAMHLRWWKSLIVKCVLGFIFKQVPLYSLNKKGDLFQMPLDDKMIGRIAHYIEKYVLNRYQKGKAREYFLPVDADIPKPFSFVFGHTHQPTQKPEPVEIQGLEFSISNTGGWLRSDNQQSNGVNAGVQLIHADGMEWISLEGKLS
ncbi:metallophosphoesterase [bacterium]|nr:metallophosphoesterase [bacterium]